MLGSLPGEASLAAGRYYAHPRNMFWRLMSPAAGCNLDPLAYDERLDALSRARIGLWDVIGSARRRGSLDAAIRDASANPLAELVGTLPDLAAVAFNGATAARIGRRALGEGHALTLVDLPSSSPAHAAMSYAEKARRWAELSAVLA